MALLIPLEAKHPVQSNVTLDPTVPPQFLALHGFVVHRCTFSTLNYLLVTHKRSHTDRPVLHSCKCHRKERFILFFKLTQSLEQELRQKHSILI